MTRPLGDGTGEGDSANFPNVGLTEMSLDHSAPRTRLLCISPYFPPLANAESICSGKMINELRRAGLDVTVLTVAYRADHPGAVYDESLLWRGLKSITTAIPTHGNIAKPRSGLLAIKYQVSSWPRWIHKVVRVATEMHTNRPFQMLYSRSYPMVAHVAAFWLQRKLRIPWIANINDPWDVDMVPNGAQTGEMLRGVSRMWMRRVFKTADVITFPSERLLGFHSQLSEITTRTSIVPHIGYAANSAQRANSEFVILHAGKLGSAEITRRGVTRSFLEGFRKFAEALPSDAGMQPKFVLVGPHDTETERWAAELGVAEKLEFTGRVDYEASLAHIATASVCLLIEGRFATGIFLPSKLADYVAAGKPIIALSPKTGVVDDLAGRFRGILRVDLDDPDAISRTLAVCFSAHTRGRLDELAPSSELGTYFDGDAIARAFCELVSKLTCPTTRPLPR
jgi:hypothetical protein